MINIEKLFFLEIKNEVTDVLCSACPKYLFRQ